VSITVVVGIDGGLEPGEDLVGPGIDAVTALRVRLPASHTHGQDRGAGRDPVKSVRAFGPGDDSCELGRMALGLPTDARQL